MGMFFFSSAFPVMQATEISEVDSTVSANPLAEQTVPFVSYRTHIQDFGWQGEVRDGELSGSVGQAKRLEAIEINLGDTPVAGGIDYQVHV